MVNQPGGEFEPIETMELAGGHLCLDFTNTASGRTGRFRDRLRDYGDLVTWAERVGLVDPAGGERLRAAAGRAPAEAGAVLDRARALRESVYRLFAERGGSGGPGVAEDLARVGEEAGTGAAKRRLVESEGGYRFAWPEPDRLEALLWPVALAAAELLTSAERERVKECAANDCNWLFLDFSRNRSRRWCDMKVCGNRAKARRFAERKRG